MRPLKGSLRKSSIRKTFTPSVRENDKIQTLRRKERAEEKSIQPFYLRRFSDALIEKITPGLLWDKMISSRIWMCGW